MKYISVKLKQCFWCEKSRQPGPCAKAPFDVHEFETSVAESCTDETLKKYGLKRADFRKA
jgi:hypothetical protein